MGPHAGTSSVPRTASGAQGASTSSLPAPFRIAAVIRRASSALRRATSSHAERRLGEKIQISRFTPIPAIASRKSFMACVASLTRSSLTRPHPPCAGAPHDARERTRPPWVRPGAWAPTGALVPPEAWAPSWAPGATPVWAGPTADTGAANRRTDAYRDHAVTGRVPPSKALRYVGSRQRSLPSLATPPDRSQRGCGGPSWLSSCRLRPVVGRVDTCAEHRLSPSHGPIGQPYI